MNEQIDVVGRHAVERPRVIDDLDMADLCIHRHVGRMGSVGVGVFVIEKDAFGREAREIRKARRNPSRPDDPVRLITARDGVVTGQCPGHACYQAVLLITGRRDIVFLLPILGLPRRARLSDAPAEEGV